MRVLEISTYFFFASDSRLNFFWESLKCQTQLLKLESITSTTILPTKFTHFFWQNIFTISYTHSNVKLGLISCLLSKYAPYIALNKTVKVFLHFLFLLVPFVGKNSQLFPVLQNRRVSFHKIKNLLLRKIFLS